MKLEKINELKKSFDDLKNFYIYNKGKLEEIVTIKENKEKELTEIETYSVMLEQVSILLQKASEYQRGIACKQIEELGTFALQYIFGSDFWLELEIKGTSKKPEIDIYVVSVENDEKVKNTPYDNRGGGIVDIVSLTLQIVMLEVYSPKIDGPIVLDEPAKHLSSKYTEQLANFFKTVSEKFNRQLIIITHNEYLAEVSDKKIEVFLLDGESCISKKAGGN